MDSSFLTSTSPYHITILPELTRQRPSFGHVLATLTSAPVISKTVAPSLTDLSAGGCEYILDFFISTFLASASNLFSSREHYTYAVVDTTSSLFSLAIAVMLPTVHIQQAVHILQQAGPLTVFVFYVIAALASACKLETLSFEHPKNLRHAVLSVMALVAVTHVRVVDYLAEAGKH